MEAITSFKFQIRIYETTMILCFISAFDIFKLTGTRRFTPSDISVLDLKQCKRMALKAKRKYIYTNFFNQRSV